jgi:hypothetical protein
MKVIKDIALAEPLVDVVDSKAVMTNATPILSLDITTCTKAVRVFYVVCSLISMCLCAYVRVIRICVGRAAYLLTLLTIDSMVVVQLMVLSPFLIRCIIV